MKKSKHRAGLPEPTGFDIRHAFEAVGRRLITRYQKNFPESILSLDDLSYSVYPWSDGVLMVEAKWMDEVYTMEVRPV